MPWKQPYPKDTNTDLEKGNFAREIWTRVKFGRFAFAPTSVPATSSATFTIGVSAGDVVTEAVRNLRSGMGIKVTWPSAPGFGLQMDSYCTADNELKVQIQNFSAGPVVPPAGNYAFMGVVI